ncbi:hypothetical protein ABZY45_14745 [Streptomyces sp. NPDC006516]|uniref:hypothetical protein n=1 Tax=Streptomyces sp. NPDC006516 TaxID=3154309 RepID=UPI00339DB19A
MGRRQQWLTARCTPGSRTAPSSPLRTPAMGSFAEPDALRGPGFRAGRTNVFTPIERLGATAVRHNDRARLATQ